MEDLLLTLASNLPAVVLLILGYALVVTELYVPGFGVFGLFGGIFLVAGIVIAAQTPVQAFLLVGVVLVLVVAALLICLRSTSRKGLLRGKLVLQDVATQKVSVEKESGEYDGMLHRKGVAQTMLRPAGIGEFDGERLPVVSEGGYISEGTPIAICEVTGTRIVVRADGAAQ